MNESFESLLAKLESPETKAAIDANIKAAQMASHTKKEEQKMKNISINNGLSFCDPAEALKAFDLDTIAHYMDDETRELVHFELAPCTDLEFLLRYLELAEDDLIIG